MPRNRTTRAVPLRRADAAALAVLGLVLLYVGSLPIPRATLPEVALNLLRTDSLHQLLVGVTLLVSEFTLLAGSLHTRGRPVLILSAAETVCLLFSKADLRNPCCSVLYVIAAAESSWSDMQSLEWFWFSRVPAGCTLLASAHWWSRREFRISKRK